MSEEWKTRLRIQRRKGITTKNNGKNATTWKYKGWLGCGIEFHQCWIKLNGNGALDGWLE